MAQTILDGSGNGYEATVNSDRQLLVYTGGDSKLNVNTLNNELLVNLEGHQCPGNSTVAQLGSNTFFLGSTWQDTLDYGVVSVNVSSDVTTPADGLEIQWSNNGSIINDYDKFTILENQPKTFTFGPAERYYRLKYTNGSVDTTTFHLTSLLRRCYVKPSSHRITDSIVGQDDAELVKSVSTGLAPDGTFKNVLVTNAGEQKISLEAIDGSLSSNSNTQLNITPFDSTGSELFLNSYPGAVQIYNSPKNGSAVGPMELDDSTFANTSISYEHHEVHGGNHYNIRGFQTINSGARLTFEFTAPNTSKWVHIVFAIDGTSQLEVRGWEGATLSGGTIVTPINNNRNSTNMCACIVRSNPVISGTTPTSGLLIESHSKGRAGATPAASDNAGTVDRADEWVLRSGTTYMWELKSADDNNVVDYAARWYEHTDKIAIN